jgi:adenosylmethionine-8-amino-7-oxononanoate aminotransferase
MQPTQGAALLQFARNGAYGPGGSELRVLERGEGPHVFDTAGHRYVDGLSSLFCAQIGYSHGAEMAEAAGARLERLVREFIPARPIDAGLIARADNRGDPVRQIAAPLIGDDAVLDAFCEAMRLLLRDAGRFMGVAPRHARLGAGAQ